MKSYGRSCRRHDHRTLIGVRQARLEAQAFARQGQVLWNQDVGQLLWACQDLCKLIYIYLLYEYIIVYQYI